MEFTGAGFDFSALSEVRSRLLAGVAEERLLTQLLTHFVERGLLKARGTQRTDSTHIVAAVRELNRLEIVGETLRYTLNVLAQLVPDWLRDHVTPERFLRYGQRFSDYWLPKGQADRHQFAEIIGRDGSHVLTHVYRADAPPHVRTVPAVELLQQAWVQHYYQENGVVHWRDAKNFPPSSMMIASPYDPEPTFRSSSMHLSHFSSW